MTKHYENLEFMAQLRDCSPMSRRLLSKFARMGMFYQRIRRYSSLFTKGPVLRIGSTPISAPIRTLYSVFDLSYCAKLLLASVNEIISQGRPLTYSEICDVLKYYHRKITLYRMRTIRYPSDWRIVRFALLCDNQCIIVEIGEFGYEVIGYYIKASKFMSIDCIPEKNLPEYRHFSNFL